MRVDRVDFGGRQYVVRALADKQQYADDRGDAERAGISSAQWPLFGQLWPSGRVLAEVMSSFELQHIPGSDPSEPGALKHILELGCGLAMASVVIHRRGGHVTASDQHPLARAFLLANTALNALSPIAFHQNDWAGDSVIAGRFDVIIGSDLLYERHHAASLAACIARHGHVGTEVVIVDPGRGQGGRFARALEGHGYEGTATPVSPRRYDGIPYRGTVYGYRRRADALPDHGPQSP